MLSGTPGGWHTSRISRILSAPRIHHCHSISKPSVTRRRHVQPIHIPSKTHTSPRVISITRSNISPGNPHRAMPTSISIRVPVPVPARAPSPAPPVTLPALGARKPLTAGTCVIRAGRPRHRPPVSLLDGAEVDPIKPRRPGLLARVGPAPPSESTDGVGASARGHRSSRPSAGPPTRPSVVCRSAARHSFARAGRHTGPPPVR